MAKNIDKLSETTQHSLASTVKALETCQQEIVDLKLTVGKFQSSKPFDAALTLQELHLIRKEFEQSIADLNNRLTSVETLYIQRLTVAFIGAVLLTATCTYFFAQLPPWL